MSLNLPSQILEMIAAMTMEVHVKLLPNLYTEFDHLSRERGGGDGAGRIMT